MSPYLLVLLGSIGLAVFLTPLSIYLGQRFDVLARPGGRRQHRGNVSKLGGIVVMGAFLGGALISLAARPLLPLPPEGPDPNEMTRFTAVLAGTLLIGLFGLFDDHRELHAGPQYMAQLTVSVVAIVGLVFIERVRNPFTGNEFVFPALLVWGLTVPWLVGMMNTVNFLDGLDGLCAGVTLIAAGVMFIHMQRVGQYGPALLPLALVGTMLGFMPFNLTGRIFLGSGAVTLGYLVGTLSLIAGARVATILLVLGIPIVDVAWQIFDRWRRGRSMNEGDRGHLHYRLYDMGWQKWQVLAVYWGFCAMFGALALVVSPPLYKLLAILGLAISVVAVLGFLSHPRYRRRS